MRDHLRPEEFVDALDDALDLDASARAHLDACERCTAELAGLRSVVMEASGVEPPAPSPLFWDHFSERVREATAREPQPSAERWWNVWWRPAGAIAGALGAIALIVFLQPASFAPTIETVENDAASIALTAIPSMPDDGSWGLVVDMAAGLEASDVSDIAAPAAGAVDSVLEELTSAQRAALARLLQKEMGEL